MLEAIALTRGFWCSFDCNGEMKIGAIQGERTAIKVWQVTL